MRRRRSALDEIAQLLGDVGREAVRAVDDHVAILGGIGDRICDQVDDVAVTIVNHVDPRDVVSAGAGPLRDGNRLAPSRRGDNDRERTAHRGGDSRGQLRADGLMQLGRGWALALDARNAIAQPGQHASLVSRKELGPFQSLDPQLGVPQSPDSDPPLSEHRAR